VVVVVVVDWWWWWWTGGVVVVVVVLRTGECSCTGHSFTVFVIFSVITTWHTNHVNRLLWYEDVPS